MNDDFTCSGCGAPMVRKGEYSWECPYCTRTHDDPYLIGVGKLMDDAIRRVDKMKETVETFELRMSSDFVPGDTVDLKVVPKKGDMQGSVSLLTEDAEWDAATAEWMNVHYGPGYEPDLLEETSTSEGTLLVISGILMLTGILIPPLLFLAIPGIILLIAAAIVHFTHKMEDE